MNAICSDDEVCRLLRTIVKLNHAVLRIDTGDGSHPDKPTRWTGTICLFCEVSQLISQIRAENTAAAGVE